MDERSSDIGCLFVPKIDDFTPEPEYVGVAAIALRDLLALRRSHISVYGT